jgi:hypothetical protein
MTMNFETLEDSITTLLTAAEAGRYTTIGWETRSESGDEVVDNGRTVQVFYSEGEFPGSGGSIRGPIAHDPMQFRIILTASKGTTADLAVLDNPSATDAQRITALANIQYAEKLASKSWNELAGIVWNELMDVRNKDLGLASNSVGSRWIQMMKKDDPVKYGSLVVVRGGMLLTCKMNELISGATGTPISTVETSLDVNGDTVGVSGVKNDDY